MPLFGPPNIEKMKAKGDIKGLLKALSMNNSNVRKAAIKALVQIGGTQVADQLVDALRKNPRDDTIAEALVKMGSDAVAPLISALGAFQPEVRIRIIEILGEIGDPRAAEPIINRLGGARYTDLDFYTTALIKIGMPAKVLLADKLYQRGKSAYSWHAVALARFGDVRAVKPLAEAMSESTRKGYPDNAKFLFDELMKLGETDVNALVAALPSLSTFDRDFNTENALVKIGRPAVEPLITALKAGNNSFGILDAYIAARALAKIGDRRACGPIIDYMFQMTDSHVALDQYSLSNLFKGYSEIIVNLINGVTVKEETIRDVDQDWYEDRLASRPSFTTTTTRDDTVRLQAFERLCSYNTPVSSNLLHKVKNAMRGIGCDEIRQKAADELVRRGNPPYEPSVYFDEAAWR